MKNKKTTLKALFLLIISLLVINIKTSELFAQTVDSIPLFKQDKLIQIGLTSQSSNEISGSVSSIEGHKLERSPVSNTNQSLQGRFSGLHAEETYSELSEASVRYFIRGLSVARIIDPLVVIDGVMFPYNGLDMLRYYISPSTIQSITILKDASTQAIFGIQGANGVINVTTKQGEVGKLKIRTRLDQSFQEVTTKPVFINSAEYAQLRNQAASSDGLWDNYYYDSSDIEKFQSGEDPLLYPNNNWYDLYMRDYAMMQRADLSLSGGSDFVKFFSNINFLHQGSQFKTEQTAYNSNFDNFRVNFRSNVDAKLNDFLGAYLYLNGSVKRNHLPGHVGNSNAVYNSLFDMPPTTFGPLTPEEIDPETGEVISGGQVITTQQILSPTYGILNRSGYRRNTNTNIYTHFGLNVDMGAMTKGLKGSVMFAYQANYTNNQRTTQEYERWIDNRTQPGQPLSFVKKGDQENTPLAYGKGTDYYYHITYKGDLNYNRSFGKHDVAGMAYLFYQDLSRPEKTLPWLLPSRRFNSGAQVMYGYDKRYYLKLDAGYSASDKYHKDHRFLATPALSGSWILSNESFMTDVNWLSFLKLKASYGLTGNDQDDILGRYPYLDDVVFSSGGNIQKLMYNITERDIGNKNIEPEVSKKQNYGIELGLFDAFTFSFDLFKERMENMVIRGVATIPLYQGIPLDIYPAVNDGIFENMGYDFSVNFARKINNDFSMNIGGFLSYSKNEVIKSGEIEKTEDYFYSKTQEGFPFGQQWGFLVDYSNGNGFFNSQAELNTNNLEYGFVQPRVGDLIYQDLNQDGIIDEKDIAPLGSGFLPNYLFGFTGDFEYKGFDLNFLFQGVSKWSSLYNIQETVYDGRYGTLHKNAWTPERFENRDKITYPALSLKESSNHQNSDFNLYDRSYIRLKNLEIGYTLPLHTTNSSFIQKVRFLLSGQNLLTFDKMKSSDFGPEGNYAAIPIYRVYNIGVTIDF